MILLVFLLLFPSISAAATASWDAVADSELQGYKLYRAPGSCDNHGYFEFVNLYGVTTSGPVTDPSDSGTYCHYLTAFNAGGESTISNLVEFVYTVVPTPPQCPDVTYCQTLKGKARRKCLACQ